MTNIGSLKKHTCADCGYAAQEYERWAMGRTRCHACQIKFEEKNMKINSETPHQVQERLERLESVPPVLVSDFSIDKIVESIARILPSEKGAKRIAELEAHVDSLSRDFSYVLGELAFYQNFEDSAVHSNTYYEGFYSAKNSEEQRYKNFKTDVFMEKLAETTPEAKTTVRTPEERKIMLDALNILNGRYKHNAGLTHGG